MSLSILFAAVSPLPINQAATYFMLQFIIMYLTRFNVFFILELSIVLVLGLLHIFGTGFDICSSNDLLVEVDLPHGETNLKVDVEQPNALRQTCTLHPRTHRSALWR